MTYLVFTPGSCEQRHVDVIGRFLNMGVEALQLRLIIELRAGSAFDSYALSLL